MKKLIVVPLIVIAACSFAQAQRHSKKSGPRQLADKVATAFSIGIGRLDRQGLLRGRLHLTKQNWIAEPEFEYQSFRSFTAMQRSMKREENQPGFIN